MSAPALIGGVVALGGGFAALAHSASAKERTLGAFPPNRPDAPRVWRNVVGARTQTVGAALAGAALGAVLGGVAGTLVGAGCAAVALAVARRRRSARRADLLGSALADGVSAIAAALRAGLSLSQAIVYASGEIEEPLAETFARVTRRESLGEPLEFALERWTQEVGGDDPRLVAGVLSLHRRTGGDLPRVLDRVVDMLRERQAAEREVRALTAQARLSGTILGVLPIGFFLFLVVTSRQDMAAAFQTSTGFAAVGLGVVLEAGAFVWIRRLLRVT